MKKNNIFKNPLISVIIPNYNGEKYIINCLDSVINQDYNNKEVIIIDDGSTDNSVNLIKKYLFNHPKYKIKLICQNNLNASIARNEGIKYANGDYILFLDSDDILKDNIINELIGLLDEDVDLIVGNYDIINEKGKVIDSKIINKKEAICDRNYYLNNYLNNNPVPSNKLYSLKIIKDNNLYWGNVKIGQDLNFYLKYLLKCNKISLITNKIYEYRIVNGSMSRNYNFNIFDITNSFEDVKKYYIKNNEEDTYNKYLQVVELLHYYSQILKSKKYKTLSEKKLVVNYFSIMEKKIRYNECCNYNKYFKKVRIKFYIVKYFKYIYFMTSTNIDKYLFKLFFRKRGKDNE